MPHHLVGEIHQKIFCIYCKRDIPSEKWESEWHAETHYKTLNCDCCGKKLHIKMDFHGSGHDEWTGNKLCPEKSKKEGIVLKKQTKNGIKNIEDQIKVVERIYPKK